MKCGYRLCPRSDAIPRIPIFFNAQLFFCGYGFRPHVSGESARHTNPQLFESALQSGNYWIRSEFGNLWTLNPEFFTRWRKKIGPSSLQWKAEQDANFARFKTHALLPIFPEVSCKSFKYGPPQTWKFFSPDQKSCGFKNTKSCKFCLPHFWKIRLDKMCYDHNLEM